MPRSKTRPLDDFLVGKITIEEMLARYAREADLDVGRLLPIWVARLRKQRAELEALDREILSPEFQSRAMAQLNAQARADYRKRPAARYNPAVRR